MGFLDEWRGEETDYLNRAEGCFTFYIILISAQQLMGQLYTRQDFSSSL